jgi:hypothetical protein
MKRTAPFFIAAPAVLQESGKHWDILGYNLPEFDNGKAATDFATMLSQTQPGKVYLVLECVAYVETETK